MKSADPWVVAAVACVVATGLRTWQGGQVAQEAAAAAGGRLAAGQLGVAGRYP